MNILLNPIGSIGDVNPYIGLGLALRNRGHEVTIITNPRFEPLISKVKLGFAAVGTIEDFQTFHDREDIWKFSKSWKPALRWGALSTMRATFEVIRELYQPGRTVLAGPGMAFGSRVAQEKLGIPFATIHLEPDKLRSAHLSPVMPPPLVLRRWIPRSSKRLQFWIGDKFFADPFLAPELNGWRRELGLPPANRIVADWWHSPQRIICLFPSWFAPPQPDWPAQTELSAFPLWDQDGIFEMPDSLRQFLAAGEAPIVFTAGTANAHSKSFYSVAVKCCEHLNRRGILICKDRRQAPDELTNDVRWFSYVPFSQLLNHCAAVVHHGGIGTSALALAAGVPQLVMPMTFAQPDTAARLKRLGVAEVIKPRAFRTPKVVSVLQRLLMSSHVEQKCQHWKRKMVNEKPFERACELLEEIGQSSIAHVTTQHIAPGLESASCDSFVANMPVENSSEQK